ncbi:copper amine oxidase-like protein [Fontibacillus phaseoli]|uniref:Copper amine oxidase-like protein n=1 Tax=Fontibacillus phaseoli TaxID=1416533 RepID=A0A369B826_9BACL|nr:copper amine oxidase N-terminal domain-containing protein [Fontibacillus phaseoli]RCX17673.1 copper amine oxidase-like protein [Fontibacillus phaseoli]
MKKTVCLTLIGCLTIFAGLFSYAPSTSAAAPTYTLYIDGKVSSAKLPTVVEKGTTLIPMKAVLTELNYTTTVDSKSKSVTAKNTAGSYITVQTGSKKAKINGTATLLAAPAKAMNGTTYIPLSAVKPLTGKVVGADASKGIAWIGEKPAATAPVPVWGVSPDQMKAVSGEKLLLDEGGSGDIYLLLYQESLDDPEELYIFYKNKLAKIAFTPDISGFDESGLIGVYEGMFDNLAEVYGQPESDIIAAYKDTHEQIPLADGGYLTSKWNVGGTKIMLLLKGTDTGYTVNMQYIDTSVEAQVEAAMDAIE